MRHQLIFILFFLGMTNVFGQTGEEQLAAQYFSNAEFDKAADIYEKLLQKNPASGYYYENLLVSYLSVQKYDEAEKLTKKQQRKFSNNYYFKVDQGFVYKKQNALDAAQKTWVKLIQELTGEEFQANELASAFQKREEIDLAIQTYETARKKSNSQFQYCFELARLYGAKRQTSQMVTEYLNALEGNPSLMDLVQGYLQLYMQKGEDYDIVKTAIQKKYKENASNETFSELLVWLYVQKKDFNSAFIQVKALDRRYKEEGQRIIQLANLASQNECYKDALMMYGYVISLGKDKTNYMAARIGNLNTLFIKTTNVGNASTIELTAIEKEYLDFLIEFGRYYYTATVMRDLARLRAYYLNNYPAAIEVFQELILMPRLENHFKADCKLELGDIYVIKGEEWEAMLLYGQVDKDFKEDPRGQEAKFRNAKLSYYMGEFEWARAQLDVLKTATTQLIANNALELSLLIQDNTKDSIEEPLLIFAKADLYLYQNKAADALLLLDSLDSAFPRHDLADEVLMKRAEISYKQNDFVSSQNYLNQLLKEHGSDVLGDNALYMLAEISDKKLKNTSEALKLYEEFLAKYPGSFYTTEVRKRYRLLRGDVLN